MVKKIKKNKKGFTLIELIVVIAIIAILAAVAVPNYLAVQQRAEDNAVLGNASIIANAINAHNALAGSTGAVPVLSTLATVADFNGACTYVPITMSDTEYAIAILKVSYTAAGAHATVPDAITS